MFATIACVPLVIGCVQTRSEQPPSESAATLRASLTVAEDADQDSIRNEDDLCSSTPANERTDGDDVAS